MLMKPRSALGGEELKEPSELSISIEYCSM
jgi:hypothetical protein